MKNLLTLLLFACFFGTSASGQVVYNLVPSSTTADNGSTITVDLTVENFVDIIGLEYQVSWDDNVLQFQNITTPSTIMCDPLNNGNLQVCYGYPNDFGPDTNNDGSPDITDYFVTNYLDPNFSNPNPNTLNDGDAIISIEFLVVGSGGQSTDIGFITSESVLAINSSFNELSLANGLLNVNNTSFTVNGTGCVGNGDVTFSASNESGDTGTSGSVKVSVDNFDDVEGFGYTINWDPNVISFDSVGGLNLPGLVNPPLPAVGSFGTSQTGNGNLFVSWSDGTGETACDGQTIFEIFYTVIGAGGTNTSVDFTGNIEVIKNSNIVPHVVNSGGVAVTGTGGPISGIGFAAGNETGDNGDQVCVPISVSNFTNVESFQYDVLWDETVLAFNSLTDANGQPLTSPILAGNPLGLLNPAPPAVGNFGLTNTSSGALTISWDNASGVTLDNNTIIYEICYDIIGQVGDASAITFGGNIEVADGGGLADFSGTPGSVNVSGVFNGVNLEWDCCPEAPAGGNVCIDVRVVEGFDNMLSLQYGSTWDPAVLTYTGIEFTNGNPLGLSVGNSLIPDVTNGNIKFFWFDNSQVGIDLDPGTSLYQVCFDVSSTIGDNTTLDFADLPNAVPPFFSEATNSSGIIDFLGNTCTVTSADVQPLSLTETITAPSCIGDIDGAIDIAVSGGVEDYTFEWSNAETTEDLSGLAAGEYTVTVTDCYGTTTTETYTISDPAAIDIQGVVTGVTTAGNDGAIDLTVTGGTGVYTFSWSNMETTEDLSGLAEGDYTVTVTDANMCTAEATFTIALGCSQMTITGVVTNQTSAGNNGAIDITVTGGVGMLSYSWMPTATTTEDLSMLTAGTYTVTVTDADMCTAEATFEVEFECLPIEITGTVTNETSVGNNGAIDISVTGGNGGTYTFSWGPNGETTEDLSMVSSGVYTVTATDSDGCEGTATFEVEFECLPIEITGVVTNETSAGNDGAIDISVSGGNGGTYTYLWSMGATSEDLSLLTPGVYTVTATDSDGCEGTATFEVTDFNCPVIAVSGSGSHVTCEGGSDGTAMAFASGGAEPYTYAWNTLENTQQITGLVAGAYTVTVTDVDGCFGVATVTVNDGVSLNLSLVSSQNLTCFENSTGVITVQASGGSGDYSYIWSGGNSTSATNSGLAADTYNVTVTDEDLGCTATLSGISISQPNDIVITGSVEDANCNGESNGSVTLNISGGTGAHTVVWSNSSSGTTLNNVGAGTYTPTVTDANGCVKIGPSFVVGEPAELNGTVSINDASCFGECDGSASLIVTGGISPYTINWTDSDGNTQTGTTATGLCAGNVSVTVIDANGCTFSNIYSVGQPAQLVLTFDVANETTIGGDGAVDLTVSPNGAYLYSWTAANQSVGFPKTTEDINNVIADIYTVVVTDPTTGCSTTGSTSVTNSLGIQTAVVTDVTCFEGNDGKIEITTVGGSPSYGWSWANSQGNIFAVTEDVFNLSAGTYSVTITDADGTQAFQSYTIGQPTEIEITNAVITNELTNGDGKIDISVQGGTPPYNYIWNTTDCQGNILTGIQDPMGLCEGDYHVTIIDAEGCFIQSPTYTIVGSIPQVGSVQVNETSCINDCDGSIVLNLLGGDAPYDVQYTAVTMTGIETGGITGPATTVEFINLCKGEYSFTITDVDGVETTAGPFNIDEPNPIVISGASADPQGALTCDGSIQLNASGGTGALTFDWGNGITGPNPQNLCSGTYTPTITDGNGCVLVGDPIQVGIEIDFLIDVTNIECNGDDDGAIDLTVNGGVPPFTYEWRDSNGVFISSMQDIDNLDGGTYEVMIEDAMGTQILSSAILVSEPDVLEITSTSISAISPPDCTNGSITIVVEGGTPYSGSPSYDYNWTDENGNSLTANDVLSGLTGGVYTVVVSDANGCTTQTIVELEGCVISIDMDSTNVSCYDANDGTATATALVGTAPFTFVWSNGASGSSISNLPPGDYTVTITDVNGIEGTETVTITEPLPLQVIINTFPGRAEAVVIGGTAPYLYKWNDDPISDNDVKEDLRGNNLHVVQVYDANGCESTMEEFRVPYDGDCMTAREVISPNEDSFNDVFFVNCVEQQETKVTIFNRWGQEVFQSNNYDNSWAGTGKRGELLPEGGYFYVLEFETPDGRQIIKGSLSIVR